MIDEISLKILKILQEKARIPNVEVARQVLEVVDEVNRAFPQINIVPVTDQGNFIERSIKNVSMSVLFGGSLAVLVLLYFLRSLRSTLVISLAIPISVIATFALLYFGGFTINLMTLGGLALGLALATKYSGLLAAVAVAVVLGAVGGPRWSDPNAKVRPEQGLLKLRSTLGVYANIRPVKVYAELADASPLKAEKLAGVDMLVIRELTGGIYFGEKTRTKTTASDVCTYSAGEIERIVRVAAKLAAGRRSKLCSVDKANVLETSRLWRDVTDRLMAAEFPDVELFVDAGPESSDHDLDLLVLQHLVDAGLFDVEYLPLQRQDRLVLAIAALLGGTAGGITLDDEKLGLRRVFFLAIRQFAGQSRNIQRALAPGHFAGLAGRLARPRGIDNLGGDGPGFVWILEQVILELFAHG